MKSLLTAVILSFIAFTTYAQNEVMAKLKFEDAFVAYENGKYKECENYLIETEKLLGTTSSKIMFLKIKAQGQLVNANPYESFDRLAELRKNCKEYISINGNDNTKLDKVKEVYEISKQINGYPTTEKDFNATIEAEKKEREWKINERNRLEAEKQKRLNDEARATQEAQQKIINNMNINNFCNIGLSTNFSKMFGASCDLHVDKFGFRIELASDFRKILDLPISSGMGYYSPTGDSAIKKTFSINIGPILKVSKKIYLFTCIGYTLGSKYREYELNNWSLSSSGGISIVNSSEKYYYKTPNKSDYFNLCSSVGGIYRLNRIINVNCEVLTNGLFKYPNVLLGVSINTIGKVK